MKDYDTARHRYLDRARRWTGLEDPTAWHEYRRPVETPNW